MDEELVVRAQQGDPRAFESLTLAHYDRLYRVAKNVLRDTHMAQDATQQACLEIWRHLPRLKDPGKFRGWSYRLLVRACHAEARRAGPTSRSVEQLSEDFISPADDYRAVVERDQLERAFGQSLDHRVVIVLRHRMGMTPDEVADALAISRRTVYSRLRRAESAMRAAIEADGRPPTTTQQRPEVVR